MNAHAQAPGVHTTCPYCGVGCGVVATPYSAGGAAIEGDKIHRLCSKGAALGETLGLETRLLHPMVDGARATWNAALDRIAGGLRRTIERHGPEAVAFYLSGQLLTEDYYAANKLMKGFIGSANVDTNSRLCMASSVAGHKRAFGSDTVPGCYEDLDEADLLVLVGSNAAWCHPVLYQRMVRAREQRGARMVTIDVRGTATTDSADLALTIAPGMDSVLFCGLLVHLADNGFIDRAFAGAHTEGFEAALAAARRIAPDLATVAKKCGAASADITAFFDLWAATNCVVTLYSQGVNQSWQGTDKVNAIINCHLATGRIGIPGAGPFSLTGQPNAMGGREVGGLANQLAAHMGFSPAEVDRVGRFWGAPRMAQHEGLKAVAMFEAIARGGIKALWIMATNPAVSLPRADKMRAALAKLDLLVISDNVLSTDTIGAGPHVLLPAAAWGEKDGTVTNSERRISRQRAFAPPAGEAKPDWWAMSEVAKQMGFGAAFDYAGPAAVFREHAALSAFENNGTRDFDLGGLARLSDTDYDALAPLQWPVPAGGAGRTKRMFADGRFFTPSGRARFIAIEEPVLAEAPDADFPFLLNTGRVRDQWHTMTRTGLSPKLASHMPDPFVEVNPDDAQKLGLAGDGFAWIWTANGSAVLRVNITAAQVPGRIFAPIHWNDETAGRARVGALVHPFTDPYSGQPELEGHSGGPGSGLFRRARLCPRAPARAAAGRHRLCVERHRGWLCCTICDQRAFRGRVRGACQGIALRRTDELQRSRDRHFSRRAYLAWKARYGALFWAGRRSTTVERSCLGMAAGAARRHRAPVSSGGQGRVRRFRCKPHNLRVLWREIAGHLGGDHRWRKFNRGGRRAAQCRHKLRILPARAEANDRRPDAREV